MKRACAIGALLGTVALAQAQTVERLDDSLSPSQRVVADVVWEIPNNQLEMSGDDLNAMLAVFDNLEVRLNTARFEGRRARIFLSLPASIRGLRRGDGLRMHWTTNGLFENGSVVPGDRALIFDGVVPGPLMTDQFDITLKIDAREVIDGLVFDPVYEIEVF